MAVEPLLLVIPKQSDSQCSRKRPHSSLLQRAGSCCISLTCFSTWGRWWLKVHCDFTYYQKKPQERDLCCNPNHHDWLTTPFERLCIESWMAHIPPRQVGWLHPEQGTDQACQHPTAALKTNELDTSTEWLFLYCSCTDLSAQKCTQSRLQGDCLTPAGWVQSQSYEQTSKERLKAQTESSKMSCLGAHLVLTS